MSLGIEELEDVIRVIVFLNVSKDAKIKKSTLKNKIDHVCINYACVDDSELEKTLKEMTDEGLLMENDDKIQLTMKGQELGKEWQSLLLKKEPIMEIVAGLVDGSITSLVVILSTFIATFATFATNSLLRDPSIVIFATLLTLSAVAITNFSSFLLGGITEDMADILTLQNLMYFSLRDNPDKTERRKSLQLVKDLFAVLGKEIHRSNIVAAVICGITTFIAGIIPIATYLALPFPPYINIIVSLSLVALIVGVFLVRYRSKKTRVNWKVTLIETLAIVTIATIVSLLLGAA